MQTFLKCFEETETRTIDGDFKLTSSLFHGITHETAFVRAFVFKIHIFDLQRFIEICSPRNAVPIDGHAVDSLPERRLNRAKTV